MGKAGSISLDCHSSIFDQAAFQKCDGLFAGCGDGGLEPTFGKRTFENKLNVGIVFND